MYSQLQPNTINKSINKSINKKKKKEKKWVVKSLKQK